MIPVALELVTGAGLPFRRRWAWVLGILTSVFLIEEGLRRVIFSPDRELTVLFSWTIQYFIPAIVILVCLLPGRARLPSSGRGSRMPAEPTDEAGDLRSLLETLDPKARDTLRRVLIHDLIDFLILHKEERRKALRLLGESEATASVLGIRRAMRG